MEWLPRQLELRENEGVITDDSANIATLKQFILDGMNAGAGFHTANHEGGTDVTFRDGGYWRDDYGEYPGSSQYQDAEDLLQWLRKYYDWEANRDHAPGKAPEVEVWKFIVGKLRK